MGCDVGEATEGLENELCSFTGSSLTSPGKPPMDKSGIYLDKSSQMSIASSNSVIIIETSMDVSEFTDVQC